MLVCEWGGGDILLTLCEPTTDLVDIQISLWFVDFYCCCRSLKDWLENDVKKLGTVFADDVIVIVVVTVCYAFLAK